ncbi:uncharacterized protein LOC135944028 isoform X3 [Cloeon dipterum]|uniref:uncharacterized protein LOC135944028 isoform X3 n=1 Tax=Cloeon dipterum TaxID=197152 RepID=UPI00321F7AB3
MADLAERVDDLICTFEGGGETTMDTVAMLIFGWMVFGLFVLAIGKYLYQRLLGGLPEDAKPVIEDISAVTIPSVSVEDGAIVVKPVPPTPPVRRRTAPKKVSPGPAPPPASGRSAKAASPGLGAQPKQLARHGAPLLNSPTATGPDTDSVRWVNRVFQWLYCDLTAVQDVINTWILALNEFTKKSVTEHGVGVEFVRVLPESHAPSLSSVFSECASNDDVTITCDFEASPALQLKAFRQKGEKVEVSHYRVNVNRLRARLNLSVITEKLLVDAKFDGWPDIKVSLAQVGSIRNSFGADESAMQEVINDIVVTAIRSSTIHLNFSKYNACPRFDRYSGPLSPILPVHYDSMVITISSHKIHHSTLADLHLQSNHTRAAAEKRLLVKVVKAVDLGSDKGCGEPYCVVEMDEPPQKFATAVRPNTNSPIWDEHFKFELSPHTMELLFEIFDRTNRRFLGLGIVGVEELLANPSQRQVIVLQPRPYEPDQVSGTLTVEFMFVDVNDGSVIGGVGDMPLKLKETVKSVSPTGAVITTTKTVYSKDGVANGVDGLADSALRELELRNARIGANTQANKSTLIIHSVQRQTPPRPVVKVELTEGQWHEVPEIVTPEPGQEAAESLAGEATNGVDPTLDERGRTKKKKRDFFGTIKKRLSRSKNRSKSVDPSVRDESLGRDTSLNRSVSADRARDSSIGDPNRGGAGYLSVPKGLEGSTRSSLSEASGISGASNRTYVSEASTLVLESIENGVKKHYLVPLSLAQRSKWRKKGIKLHIYNDHTFVAKHLPGGTVCTVCTKSVARRIGKQGYECRDCLMRCHKHCHIKADSTCPNSTIQSIELSLLPVLSE